MNFSQDNGIGKKVGVYTLEQKLGEGSFGRVYKAIKQNQGEIYAIKCIDQKKLVDKFLIDSLKKEIEIMKKFNSDHIVKIFDVFDDKTIGITYLVLEYCDSDLSKLIEKQQGFIPEIQSKDIIIQVMDGMHQLVNNNYIHRDIKPDNVLVKGNIFKLADFGFATEADIKGKTQLKIKVGSPLFMAPQLLQNQSYSAKSDIWSIGMMYYLMVFGCTPWPCRDINSFLQNLITTPLRFPYNKQISEESKDFLKKTLIVDEQKRIEWEDFFQLPLLQKNSQLLQQEKTHNLDQHSALVLKQLQEIVAKYKLDLKQIFNNFDKDKGGTLDKTEFYNMLQVVDKSITFSEAFRIFKQVDIDQTESINFQEFQQMFTEFEFRDVNDLAGRIIHDLQEVIKANKYDVTKIFKTFDNDEGGQLDLKEFTSLMKALAPGLKNYEIKLCFDKFDINKDGGIQLSEFISILDPFHPNNQIAMKQQSQQSQQSQQQQQNTQNINSAQNHQQKSLKILQQLKQVIVKNNLPLLKIFKNFDKSGDGNLDINEFSKMIQVIDKDVHLNDIQLLFEKFDTDKTGQISFIEFSKQLGQN